MHDFSPIPSRSSGGPSSSAVEISDDEFHRLQRMILDQAGIALAEGKRQLLVSRLARRLRHHGYASFTQYIRLLEQADEGGAERRELLNAITTNKTSFFREPHHFEFLREELEAKMERCTARGEPRRIRIWSAACSSGEEPYSIAMTLREAFGEMRGWDVKILASDLDTSILQKAAEGVYEEAKLDGVAEPLRRRFFAPADDGAFRVHPDLRSLVTFRQINLNGPWEFRAPFDAIFCRNVIIYFNRDTQDVLFRRMARFLAPEGHLFIGHSETLHWMSDVYRVAGRTIYRLGASAGCVDAANEREGPPAATRSAPPATGARSPEGRRAPPSPAQRAPSVRTTPVAAEDAAVHRETIGIGGVFASREPAVVRTVLGSCVSVCLYDEERRIGGMNHFMLPESRADWGAPSRYGVHAMELLINEIMKLGGDRRRLQAKIVGGALVLRFENTPLGIGEQNIEFARQFLARERIPIVAERLGGTQPLQVFFATHSAKVRVRALGRERVDDLVQEELRFRVQVSTESEAPSAAGEVTLF